MNGRMYSSLCDRGYWAEAARQFSSPRMLAVCAMFIALRSALSWLYIPLTDALRIQFTFFITALGASIYGPLMALAEGFLSDTIGFFLMPSGGYFPGYTLNAMLASLFYALFFYRRQLSVLRIFAAKFTVNLVVNVLLGALWSALLYGKGYLYTVTASILKNVVLLPLETAVMVLVFRAVHPLLTRLALIPAQPRSAIPWIARKGAQRQ